MDNVTEQKQTEMDVIINGSNRVMINGYVTGLKYNEDKKRMFFNLGAVSTSIKKPGTMFTMYVPTFFFNNGAAELSKRTYDGMYVEVEAKLRGEDKVIDIEALHAKGIKSIRYTEYKLIGTHLQGAEQIKKRLRMESPKEADNG